MTDDIPVTPAIHDAVRDWYKDRMAVLNLSELSRRVDTDASFFRKVLNMLPVEKPLRFSDELVRRLSVEAASIGMPLAIKVKR